MTTTYTSPASLGDKLYSIQRFSKPEWELCTTCDGTGEISIKDTLYRCPECGGHKGRYRDSAHVWQLQYDYPLTIGQIRLEHTKGKEPKWVVMCKETGVGSGTLHNMVDMFATIEEALEECVKRNKQESQK